MTQNLDQDLVNLGYRRLRPDGATELGLDHREGRFHVRSLVVVGQEFGPVEVVVVVRPLPQAIPLVVTLMAYRVDF